MRVLAYTACLPVFIRRAGRVIAFTVAVVGMKTSVHQLWLRGVSSAAHRTIISCGDSSMLKRPLLSDRYMDLAVISRCYSIQVAIRSG